MEAYGAACVSYAQQLFAFSNRELVARGHYGPAPPAPGMTFTQPGAGGGANGFSQNGLPSVTMPVRIDPEEEKRLAILRKRGAASEAKREVLETEYLSLRAHFVHECHKLRRTRSAVTGELKLLRELVQRRGQALALRRVKCAVSKDILSSFEYRAKAAGVDTSAGASASASAGQNQEKEPTPIMATKPSLDIKTPSTTNGDIANHVPADLEDVWALIESQLLEAELSCTDIETPEELLYIKAALCADATALEAAGDVASSEKMSAVRRSRSPVRFKDGDEEDEIVEKGAGKKKSRSERAAKRFTDDAAAASSNGGKKRAAIDQNDNVIPWSCRVMPRTPFNVALYLSNLSNSPELAAAFGKMSKL